VIGRYLPLPAKGFAAAQIKLGNITGVVRDSSAPQA
jgi:hypothetical protein